jgi:predicted dienelactone hydrolase
MLKYTRHIFARLALLLLLGGSCTSVESKKSNDSFSAASVAFPKPTGNFPVGLRKLHFVAPNRNDPYLDIKMPRELMVNLYYPAQPVANQREAPYLDSPLLQFYQNGFRNAGLRPEVLEPIETGILLTPPVSELKPSYPLIIISPGGGVVPEFYMTLIRELVSHGIVVASINHTFNSAVSAFPDGTLKMIDPTGYERVKKIEAKGDNAQEFLIQTHVDDIDQTLSALKTIEVSQYLNFSRIGILGHSLGGRASTRFCSKFSICRAGVNMDGAITVPSNSLKKPFLFLAGKNTATAFRDIKSASTVIFENAEHMDFSDWRLLNSYLLKKHEQLNLFHTLNRVNTIVRDFFLKHL